MKATLQKVPAPTPSPGGRASPATDLAALAAVHPEELLVAHLPLIERLIRLVSRRHRLSDQDAEELGSIVRLKLVDNNYAVLRQFRGHSSLSTFLAVVIVRQCLDYRTAAWGKWRPSAEARRLGPVAIRLETLVVRDKFPFDQACEAITATDAHVTRGQLLAVMDRLPLRSRRCFYGEATLATIAADTPAPDAQLTAPDETRRSSALAASLARLNPQDRSLVELRFYQRLTVANIARRYGVDQRSLYRRFERVLHRLKVDLEKQGVVGGV